MKIPLTLPLTIRGDCKLLIHLFDLNPKDHSLKIGLELRLSVRCALKVGVEFVW